MLLSTWFLFIAVASITTFSPGPAVLLAISNSIRFSFAKVVLSSLGNISGLLLISIASIFGLGVILKTSTTLFFIIKVVGASYLIYLGIRQWRSKANLFAKAERSTVSHKQKSNKRFFLEGFFIAVTNPKSILFFTALFPQFINTKATLLPQFLIMTTTFMTMSFIALIGYGLLAKKAQRWFSKGQRMKWFNRTLGSLFALIGVVLLQLKLER